MAEETQYERPNTVSGLKAKHKELSALRQKYKAEIKKLTVDIDHLDAAIRLFDPDADVYRIKNYVVKHRAQKGSVKRFILNALRTASEPMTSRQLTELWVQDRGLSADEQTVNAIRKRIGACLVNCRNQGLVESPTMTTDHDMYGPYKLWRVSCNP